MAGKPVKYCVVDAFTETAFKGNPDDWLQSVASEFNISVTCYLTPIVVDLESESETACPKFHIRWFSPKAEIDLCGHGTLAASHFLFTYHLTKSDKIEFRSLSGILVAKKILDLNTPCSDNDENGDAQVKFLIELDFPVVPMIEFNTADTVAISKSLNGSSVVEIHKTTTCEDLLVVLPSAKDVADAEVEMDKVKQFPGGGMIITGVAPTGSGFDFYSRYFCPKFGIDEDPVCGSAHCALAPYWCKKLGKCDFVAYMASPRGGVINIHFDENNQRVYLRGKAVVVAEGLLLV